MRCGAFLARLSLAVACLIVAATPADAAWEGTSLAPHDPLAVTSIRVPALMYHHVSLVPRDADPLRRDLTVTPLAFRAQLQWLRDNGYRTVSASEVWSALFEGRALPPRPVVLTFDDGYADMYDVAFPLLREFGAVGVFFVVVNLLGHEGYLTPAQVREMADAGMDIESHGMDHVNMARLSTAKQLYQFCASRGILSELTGTAVRFFAYPNGNAPASPEAIRECGYRGAFGKAGGALQERSAPFALRRTRVWGGSGASAMPSILAR